MNNPFLYNNFGQNQAQQPNYQNTQQNQGWNQNLTPTSQSTFQSHPATPQMDIFDMTKPQHNQPQANSKPLTPNDFRSLMNTQSNDSTPQFSQQIQPPRDLNQLRNMFTRDDEPIIAPITPQTNQPPPTYSTSSYSPSFTFMPEIPNQNQSNYNQKQTSQIGQSTIDFSKYDPLAGEIINSNITKKENLSENTQAGATLPDVESVPMVFYGADSSEPTNQIQFGSNFQSPQPNQNFSNTIPTNQNNIQQQPENNFFTIPSQPASNVFGTQTQQQNLHQQQTTNTFNAQQQNPDISNTQTNQPTQQQPPQTGVFNAQTTTTDIFSSQTQHQNNDILDAPQPQIQQNINIFNLQDLPKSFDEPDNPFLSQNQQTGSFGTNSFLNNTNNTLNQSNTITGSSTGTKQTDISASQKTNSAPPSYDIFRINDVQENQQQQGSEPISNITLSTTNQANSLDDIFGITTPQAPEQKQSETFHPFGQHQNNQQETNQKQSEVFHPFGQHNIQQESTQKPTVSSDNPFAIDNIFQINTNPPKSEPTFAIADDSYNPFGQPSNDKANPFTNNTPTNSESPQQQVSQTPLTSLNAFDTAPSQPQNTTTADKTNPFIGIAPTNDNPFVSSTKGTKETTNNASSPAGTTEKIVNNNNNNNQNDNSQEPFDPFGRNSTKSAENKPPETKKSTDIDFMRSLFAPSNDDVKTSSSDQATTSSTAEQPNNSDQKSTAETSEVPQNNSQSFNPFGTSQLSSNANNQPKEEAKSEAPQNNSQAFNPFSAAQLNQNQSSTTKDASQENPPAFDPFGVGNALPMVEGASFTFNIDENEEKEKQNSQKKETKTETETKTEAKQETTNDNNDPFSFFDISPPISQPQTQIQIPQQQPQIVDDLFFDFSSIPPPKSDTTTSQVDENTTATNENASASNNNNNNENVAAAATEEDENIPVGTDESSMSLSAESFDAVVSQNKGSAEAEAKEAQSTTSASNLEKKPSIGFYSDGVNSFTFNPEEELQKGPNPFVQQNSQDSMKSNPFIQGTQAQSDQKFNPFAPSSSTPLPAATKAPSTDVFKTAAEENKEAPKLASNSSDSSFNPFIQNESKSASNDPFNPFGRPQTAPAQQKQAASVDPFAKPQLETNEQKKEEAQNASASNNDVFNPFGKPQEAPKQQETTSIDPFAKPQAETNEQKKEEAPKTPAENKAQSNENTAESNNDPFHPFGSSQSNENKKNEVIDPFHPFGKPQEAPKQQQATSIDPFAKPSQDEPPPEEQKTATAATTTTPANNESFNPFGLSQPPSTQQQQPSAEQIGETEDEDIPFNPFGQIFPPKGVTTSPDEMSFTFTPRSNMTPDIDESDFLPVNGSTTTQPSPASQPPPPPQQQDQPFSPFGTFNPSPPPPQQQQEQQAQEVNSAQIKDSQNANKVPQKVAASSSLTFQTKKSSESPKDPFSILIASLNPYTEDVTSSEVEGKTQDKEHLHEKKTAQQQEADENEKYENPFIPWNPTELDNALGECKEPEELDSETFEKFDGKAPPPPSFIAFEQSPAALMLKEYCSQQLSTTGPSLEHINELLGIQDTARMSIEDFSA